MLQFSLFFTYSDPVPEKHLKVGLKMFLVIKMFSFYLKISYILFLAKKRKIEIENLEIQHWRSVLRYCNLSMSLVVVKEIVNNINFAATLPVKKRRT